MSVLTIIEIWYQNISLIVPWNRPEILSLEFESLSKINCHFVIRFFCICLLKKCAFDGSAISYGFIYCELFEFFSRWEVPPQVSNLIDQSAGRHFMRNFYPLKIDNIRDYLIFILINEKKLFRVKWIVRICMRRIHQQHYEVLWREKISQTLQTLLKGMWEKK